MVSPSKGRADYWAEGDWNALCSMCGTKYKASQLRKHWQGLYRCQRCWEPRQPQDFVHGIPDDPTAPWQQLPNYISIYPNYFVDGETPTGTINGVNKVFTTVNIPNPPFSTRLYWNGLRLTPGLDYMLTGSTITMAQSPSVGDDLTVFYYLLGTLSGDFQGYDTPVGSGSSLRLLNSPFPAESLMLSQNGVMLSQGYDYSLAGISINMAEAPISIDVIKGWYRLYTISGYNFSDSEFPSGLINSSNQVFILSNIPNPSLSLEFFWNGVFQKQGTDYTISSNIITMTGTPVIGDILTCWYRY